MRLFLAVILALVIDYGALAAEFTFETSSVRLVVRSDGIATSLLDKQTKKERLAPLAFTAVKKGGQVFPSSAIELHTSTLHISFGTSGIEADYRITERPDYLVVELAGISGIGMEEVWLSQLAIPSVHAGEILGVRWDDDFAVCLMALSERVHSRAAGQVVQASVYPEYGIVGERIAIIAVPTPRFLEVVQKVERDFQLPSAIMDGQWAKTSDAINTSYLFADLTEANADKMIAYAKLAGLRYILVYVDTWAASTGSYPINLTSFPRGEASLKEVIDKCHAAGLKVGMHMMTSAVGKNDPLVRPRPDPRLLKDAESALTADLKENETTIEAASDLQDFPREGVYSGEKGGLEIAIDDEIIHYAGIEGRRFVHCTRGFAGTARAAHRSGAKIDHIAERFGSYLADLRTSLKEAIADRVAGVINRCGFDMIYFDGSEAAMANGPYWYWASLEPSAIWARSKRELLAQGSGPTQWTWHIFSRGACDDAAAVAVKPFLDSHKIAVARKAYQDDFLPSELGWWGILADTPDHHATTPDEAEYYGMRMLALNLPISIETSMAALESNGRSNEILSILGRYEQLRRSFSPGDARRGQLATGEWHMTEPGRFEPIQYATQPASIPGQIVVQNGFAGQPFRFRLRMEAPLRDAGDPSNVILFKAKPPLDLKPPDTRSLMPGALIRRIDFTKAAPQEPGVFVPRPPARKGWGRALRLDRHRALAVRLEIEGTSGPTDPPVLDVQLESSDGIYRDYYIDLSFTGAKTVVVAGPSPERTLLDLRPAFQNFYYKSALQQFNFGKVTAMNLRWARLPKAGVTCRISLIEALAERRAKLRKLEVSTGGASILVPYSLKVGDYVESWGDGLIRIFNKNGVLLRTEHVKGTPSLVKGPNAVSVKAGRSGNLIVTAITIGP